MKKTLVLGATSNTTRYAYLAVKQLLKHGHEVVALGNKADVVEGIPILTGQPNFEGIDTVTMYINPFRQEEY